MDYKAIAQQTAQEVLSYNQDTSGWKVVKISDTFICHTITQSFAMGSISPRDFIDLVYIKHYAENMDIISSKSVDFPGYPPSSDYIRGYNHPCGFVCSP
uniref:StAR related lipid transfer domain containing 6 n=1 Tax=Jaculus jaculus TaxID=51337 RepID=A0A8C5LFP3_JACJA